MQNPPKTNTYRNVVIASAGNSILKIDYDQLELRVLAGMSGGSTMRRIFESGQDIHKHTASIIFGKDPADITETERQRGKTGNFAITYGAYEQKLVEIGLAATLDEAGVIIRQLRLAYPDEMEYIEEAKAIIRRDRMATTLHGRIRTFGDFVPMGDMEREGFNHIIQGSGAELVFIGMINAMSIIRHYNARLINQVHDEVVIEALTRIIYELKDRLVVAMEDTGFVLPLKVTWAIGPCWTI